MKQVSKRIVALLLVLVLVCSILVPTEVHAASRKIITTPTGYDSADDVEYKRTGSTIHNWGARGEDCVFLSTYAVAFYTGKNTYDMLSELSGSKMQNDVPYSELYKALQTLMVSAHKKQTSYGETRYQYCYTDCVLSDTSKISSFYSGEMFKSTWDSGATWNREHIWPASKCPSGRPDNSGRGEGADIMMLRPTLKSENGSRGNKAFGVSSGFYNPGVDVRGDCARIVLYVYVRWGNTSYMWGSGGVMENQNILFQWMAEDPVDTWEMGRNDSVQSITGTRNVFVDYPELAYILFGREIPSDMTTPSGEAQNTPAPCSHTNTEIRDQKDATCTEDGYTGDTYCKDCSEKIASGTKISATGHKDSNADNTCDSCDADLSCKHSKTEIRNKKDATCTEDGYTGDTYCKDCSVKIASGTKISATGHKDSNADNTCDSCGANLSCKHENTEVRDAKDATCAEEGYTGDTYCTDCGDKIAGGTFTGLAEHDAHVENAKNATCIQEGYTGDVVCQNCHTVILPGEVTPATGRHNYGDWIVDKEATETEDGRKGHICSDCGYAETQVIPKTGSDAPDEEDTGSPVTTIIIIVASAVVLAGAATATVIVIRKKRK